MNYIDILHWFEYLKCTRLEVLDNDDEIHGIDINIIHTNNDNNSNSEVFLLVAKSENNGESYLAICFVPVFLSINIIYNYI